MESIINSEDMANMWKKVSYADKDKHNNNITSILILESWPDIDTIITPEYELEDPKKAHQWCTIDLPEEILHYLTIRNRHNIGQAKGTLFTIPLLSQYFDWSANSLVSGMVLKEPSDTLNGKKITKEQWLPVDKITVHSARFCVGH
eukprot:403679-Ditylum_brightwellii.AAC.1